MSLVKIENNSLKMDITRNFQFKDFSKKKLLARTLSGCDVIDNFDKDKEYHGVYIKTHKDGWVIIGEVETDWYTWVNEFRAHHPKYGQVFGDFETQVYFESKRGYNHFVKYHHFKEWDYKDI